MKKIFIILFLFLTTSCSSKRIYMLDLTTMSLEEATSYCLSIGLDVSVKKEYSDYPIDYIIGQSIDAGDVASGPIIITVSLGNELDAYKLNNVNELGRVPVMMYHGIHNLNNSDTKYLLGNVDKDGYQRTSEAFRNDLEFYYSKGYRMIALKDYINGIIDVPIGLSPIVITFDDGLQNNFNVLGLDQDGNLIIDPDCAVGILEEFKRKYPDYNVTATFFVNGSLFSQEEYNNKILNWLVDHGYDVGNHSYSHADFSNIDGNKTVYEIGSIYKILNDIIPNKFVNIVALPFGSPYKKSNSNFNLILNGVYDDYNYSTVSTLRVGWESDYSPFSNDFDKTFIKRIRAYDNNGVDFDIKYNFELLDNYRYISDGNASKIVFPNKLLDKYNGFDLSYVTY